jgi:hypothetical protein
MKRCSTCKIERPLSDFWKRPSSSDGLRGRCIPCCKAGQDVWNVKNAERKAAANRAYFEAHRDENAERCSAYYSANKVRLNQQAKDYAARNPEKIRTINRRKRLEKGEHLRAERRRHYRENKPAYKAAAVARKEHVRMATPPWADLKKIAAIYAEAERMTLETGVPHHVDHIYPLRGKTMCGLHVEGNLQILHAVANLRKSNRVDQGVALDAHV